jgi:pyridinium-3,5-bisthiocarboxylic acid mononucleotide nickel chelatase
LHSLGVTRVLCGPLALGAGTVHTRHGVLPVPAPATAALIARMQAPVVPAGVDGETVTPTGAALLLAAGAQFGPVPAMTVHTVGYGAGSREVDGRANVLQALLGPDQGRIETLIQLETNVDDVTGELLGYLIARLIAEGAADAWITPVVMKKGRPAHTVHALTTPDCAAAVESVLLAETGSLGLRRLSVERLALPRHTSTVEIEGHPVRVKHGPWGAKPEYEDVVRVAAALGTTLREVLRRVR